jgi:hypothetical protein
MERPDLREERLADYLEGRLGIEQRSRIKSHLSECPHCLDAFLTANSMARHQDHSVADRVPEHVTETAVRLVSKLVTRQQETYKQVSNQLFSKMYARISEKFKVLRYNHNFLAPVRSSRKSETSEFYHVRKSFQGITIEIEIEKVSRQTATVRVTLINGDDNGNDVRVTLRNGNNRELASHRIAGEFVVFENIPFEHYNLSFVQNGNSIGTYRFEIKESN